MKPGTTDWQLTNPATRREIEGLDDYNAPQLRPSVLNGDAQAITRNIFTKMVSK
ncbi:hypothetical protein [Scytonema sp. PRP1]|uniref:hypothetical protein n=1 Tax=Scytonema sp. PRP1 TaxID=3120513 RepID=UPI002FD205D5